MTLSQDVRFLGTMAQPLGHAARVNTVRAFRGRWRPYRFWTGAEITDYDPSDPDNIAQPPQAYRAVQAGGRVHYNPKLGLWILSRLPDVRAGARAAETLSSADGVTRLRMAGPLLVTMDGKPHNTMRRHVLPAFTKAALDTWQAMIDELAAKLVGEVLDNPGCDIVQRLATPMPMLLIAHMLGIPDGDIDDFRRWSTAAIQMAEVDISRRGLTRLTSSIGGIRDIYRDFRQQFAAGGLKGTDTLLGKLLSVNASGSIDDDELFYFAMLLLIAGNETTTNLLGGMFDIFAQHPEKFDRARAAPSLIPQGVEEQLRFSSPVQMLYRTTRTEYEVGRVTIPAGARVLLSLGAANRDPQVFDDPDEFRVDRNPTEHLAFGFGAHLCLGAQLTRMEAQAVLRELVTRGARIEAIGETRVFPSALLWRPA